MQMRISGGLTNRQNKTVGASAAALVAFGKEALNAADAIGKTIEASIDPQEINGSLAWNGSDGYIGAMTGIESALSGQIGNCIPITMRSL